MLNELKMNISIHWKYSSEVHALSQEYCDLRNRGENTEEIACLIIKLTKAARCLVHQIELEKIEIEGGRFEECDRARVASEISSVKYTQAINELVMLRIQGIPKNLYRDARERTEKLGILADELSSESLRLLKLAGGSYGKAGSTC